MSIKPHIRRYVGTSHYRRRRSEATVRRNSSCHISSNRRLMVGMVGAAGVDGRLAWVHGRLALVGWLTRHKRVGVEVSGGGDGRW